MSRSTYPSPRLLLREHLSFAGLVAGGLLLTILVLTTAYHLYTGNMIDQSYWNEVVSSIVPWYVGGIGVYLMVSVFPMYIIYGDTRKRFTQRVALFSIPFCAAIALFMLLGLWAERLVYRIAGWEHRIAGKHLYDSPSDVPSFLLEHIAILLPWFALGALLGAVYDTRQEALLLAVPAAILAVGAVSVLLGLDDGPAVLSYRVLDEGQKNVAIGVMASLLISAAAIAGVRATTRNASIKGQAA